MDTSNGDVMAMEALQRLTEARPVQAVIKEIDPANLTELARRQLAKTGRTTVSRNSPCPCGSRKRFKRCCYAGMDRAPHSVPEKR